ncbi:MAG: ABC transporter substrate-binding protein [Paracoccus sp. (in: a-proteobacteria)]|uniref:ABC transporter substrate-binding protein n=1 Tax=Paracoccus sp. TaxID=267 RepID=UPI0026E0FF9B|nr:ABC transporter substrate-binding protein [Paracoccus sp. (in: a-proteobacteria)]MDO5611953.1 ABC transporter substrate-binding protein [Paracoccus sp. (in: a-proteobacteria)]
MAENVLKWGGSRDIFSLDPYSYGSTSNLAFLNHVYEGLVRYTPEFEVVPALAERWDFVAPDTWRFHLRQGVTFHDGAAFTADDVLASMKRVSDPASPLRGNIPTYVSAEKIDDHTVDIKTTSGSPLFLNDMTNIFMFDADWLRANNAEAPTDVGAKVEGFATHNTNGTGPFKVESRVPDSKTVLIRNDGWWDTPVHNLDRIEFTPITAPATRVAALLSGEIDLTDGAPIQDLDRLRASAGIKVEQRADLRTIHVVFNRKDTLADGRNNPFNDLRLRRAIDMAIDRELIGKRIMRGMTHIAGTMVAPDIPGYSTELDVPTRYDPDHAAALIDEAGLKDTPFSMVCANDESINEEQVCQAIVSMLTKVGLKPSLDIGPRAVQSPKRSSGNADVYMIGWANEPTLDAYSILVQVLHTREGAAGVANYGGWSYPELDRLTDEASVEMDAARRIELEQQALKLAKDEVVMIPLYQQPMAWAMNDKISDVVIRADNKPRHWLTRMAE